MDNHYVCLLLIKQNLSLKTPDFLSSHSQKPRRQKTKGRTNMPGPDWYHLNDLMRRTGRAGSSFQNDPDRLK
ncbi:hypothetical protein TUM12149_16020 [Morganella morganii]|nr:hypothetical protein TUM12149_16020 [Morganella morganii]